MPKLRDLKFCVATMYGQGRGATLARVDHVKTGVVLLQTKGWARPGTNPSLTPSAGAWPANTFMLDFQPPEC